MASHIGLMGCLFVIASILNCAAAADTYYVGDSLGWTIPPAGSIAYETWAYKKSFAIGDTVVFNWNSTHDVAKVSKTDYDNCNKTNPIGQILNASPANITIDSNETQYFICTIGTHCELGQKVAIGVGSSASSLTVGALSAVLLTLVISFLNYM